MEIMARSLARPASVTRRNRPPRDAWLTARMTPAELLRLLLDPDRLAVAGALVSRPMTTKEVVDASGREQRVVLTAIGDLTSGGTGGRRG